MEEEKNKSKKIMIEAYKTDNEVVKNVVSGRGKSSAGDI